MDELQYLGESDLSALIMAVHRVTQRQAPLVVVGAGLPQLVGSAGRSKSYAERLFDDPQVGQLSDLDALKALVEPVEREGASSEDAALSEIVRLTEGYPHFLQEWGYRCWNLSPRDHITARVVTNATADILASLDRNFPSSL